jgi:hypothetical protein
MVFLLPFWSVVHFERDNGLVTEHFSQILHGCYKNYEKLQGERGKKRGLKVAQA